MGLDILISAAKGNEWRTEVVLTPHLYDDDWGREGMWPWQECMITTYVLTSSFCHF